jgi:hypothetical protein
MIRDFNNKRGNFINSLTEEINSFSVKDLEKQFQLFPKLQEEFNCFKLNFTDFSFENGWDKVIEEYKKTFPGIELPKSFLSKKDFLLDQNKRIKMIVLIDFINKSNFFDDFIFENNIISDKFKEQYLSLIDLFSDFNSLFDLPESEPLIKLDEFDSNIDFTILNNPSIRHKLRNSLEELKLKIKSSNLKNLIKSIKDSIYGYDFNFGIFLLFDKNKNKLLTVDHITKIELEKVDNNTTGLLNLGFVFLGLKSLMLSNSKLLNSIIEDPEVLNLDLLLKLIKDDLTNKVKSMLSKSFDLSQLKLIQLSTFPTELMSDDELSDFIELETSILDNFRIFKKVSTSDELDRIFSIVRSSL